MSHTRRDFLIRSAIATGALFLPTGLFSGETFPAVVARRRPADQPLRFAAIGTGGRGGSDMKGIAEVPGVAMVALCDVDADNLKQATNAFPQAKTYRDYRELLDKETDLDGVTIGTPDHMHAPIAFAAIAKGLHVYCEKPLTRTVWEARRLAAFAAHAGVCTQMGNQHSGAGSMRRAIEVMQSGALGAVKEIHCWTSRPIWKQGREEPTKGEPVPADLDWNLWLGIARDRPYAKGAYHPFAWRGWYDFGCGAIGDIACHLMNTVFHGYDLMDPTTVEGIEVPASPKTGFPKTGAARFVYPARNGKPAFTLTWWEAGRRPKKEALPPVIFSRGEPEGDSALVVCENAVVLSPGMYNELNLVAFNGEDKLLDIRKHPKLAAVPGAPPTPPVAKGMGGHYGSFIRAIRDHQPQATWSHFGDGAKLTEVGLLGCVALRYPGKPLAWDGANMRFTDHEEATAMLTPIYRPGWSPVAPG